MASVSRPQSLAGDSQIIRAKNSKFASSAKREKKARRSVLIMDKIADRTITVGGIIVIVAVLGILVFLVTETLPLFKKGTISHEHEYLLDLPPDPPLTMAMDDYKTIIFLILVFTKVLLTLIHCCAPYAINIFPQTHHSHKLFPRF